MVPETNAHFEPVAWCYIRKKIGRGLAQHYELAADLPSRLLALISEIGGKPKTSAQGSSATSRVRTPDQRSRQNAFDRCADQDSIGIAIDRGGSGDGVNQQRVRQNAGLRQPMS
jgi:hypothetical protein